MSGDRGVLGAAPLRVKLMVRVESSAFPDAALIASQQIVPDFRRESETEIDAALQTWKQTEFVEIRQDGGFLSGYRDRPNSVSLVSLNGHRTLKWAGEFVRKDANWAEQDALIYAAGGPVWVRLVAPAGLLEDARPAFEQFIESIRSP